MNILLFDNKDIIKQAENRKTIRISDARFKHLVSRNFKVDDSLRVGELNKLCGRGVIQNVTKNWIEITCTLNQESLPTPQARLILALPRPKMLRRLLVDIAMLGIKDIVLLASSKVEKSFWSSPLLEPDNLKNTLIKGLEQSCDNILPNITLENKFLPFVEDKLKDFALGEIILAHPAASDLCPQPANTSFTLVVGPEAGFTDYEVEKFKTNGAHAYTLGNRHLRVETAATYLFGRLLP